jgi:hypothetical protein
MTEKKKSCFTQGCNQPVVGGRFTDDGLEVHFCEFHFIENVIAMLEDEDKEAGMKDLGIFLDSIHPPIPRHLWN